MKKRIILINLTILACFLYTSCKKDDVKLNERAEQKETKSDSTVTTKIVQKETTDNNNVDVVNKDSTDNVIIKKVDKVIDDNNVIDKDSTDNVIIKKVDKIIDDNNVIGKDSTDNNG